MNFSIVMEILMIDSEEDAKEMNVMIDSEKDQTVVFHAAAHVNVDVNVETM